jgi:release factor glutamine methyltransferase
MTFKKQYLHFLQKLQTIYSPNEANIITDWVFERFAKLKRSDIITSPDKELGSETVKQLINALSELLKHKPIQQVTGEAYFYKMKFIVNENVLIPRPETEELVELVIKEAQRHKGKEIEYPEYLQPPTSDFLHILDIGTGSGCIPVTLKKHLPDAVITSIDISAKALQIAGENAKNHAVDVLFLKMDFLNENEWGKFPLFDLIISNPPYIPISEKDKLDKNVVDYEPHTALFVQDNSPLIFYEKIASFGKTNLKENGRIFVETHEDFAEQTAVIFSSHYNSVEIKKDIFGRERFVIAE